MKTSGKLGALVSALVAGCVALLVALAISITIARFAPWREAERLLASAFTFPLWWTAAALALLWSRRRARASIAMTLVSLSLGMLTFFG